jgi:oxygen-independent coproporphyrinogen III oxidase
MAGIYIHIPFCRKTCSYCDFYKTTAIHAIPGYLEAVKKEMLIRQHYLNGEDIETLYIGGGTPSLLTLEQITELLLKLQSLYNLTANCEITLEANPDDLSFTYLKKLADRTIVNRLSIGIQSFRDEDLKLLGRRHSGAQAIQCISDAHKAGFKNLSVDLIYGIPGLDSSSWQKNIEMATDADHISAYHLTIEKGTRFSGYIDQGRVILPEEESSMVQFSILQEITRMNGFIHYEISNFAKPGYISKHNSNYWKGIKYLGLGPSAHSYDGLSRQWNIRDLNTYVSAIEKEVSFFEREHLDKTDRYNEFLMVSLRTQWGMDLTQIKNDFGAFFHQQTLDAIKPFIQSGHLLIEEQVCKMTPQGWLISDYILSHLFLENET